MIEKARWALAASMIALLVACGGITREERDLAWAAGSGDVDEVTRLLATGVDPNAYGPEGLTFIEYAAARGHVEIMDLLEAAGADPERLSRDGDTAFYGVANGAGSVEAARWLIDRGVDPCQPFTEPARGRSTTPLELAEWRGHDALVVFLTEATRECD